jgi:hypothetical protein
VAVGVLLRLKDRLPTTIDTLMLRAIPPGAVVDDVVLDAQSRQRIIDGAVANLKEFYVFPTWRKKWPTP